MTPAVKRAIETLRRAKAKLQLSDMLSAAQAFDLVAEALAGLEAEAAAEPITKLDTNYRDWLRDD